MKNAILTALAMLEVSESFLGPPRNFVGALTAKRFLVRGGATATATKENPACWTPKTFAELGASEDVFSKFELISSEEVRQNATRFWLIVNITLAASLL